ncbi:GRIP and coiled-coil domain-containing protein 1-like [Thalassophryne amazonica]|uniref:GRIP and coiled-coil domain-containing protein 1-like n=1 Tax=Thalassophryne amazonica TaxID=390379 RepID=UPI00147231DD|nr:GRIP and coiled-coil domain-containing protein 1-like [Thalassophryne amazonica]
MDKFGMSFGGGPSKKELLDMIETQKKQLVQYQTRFRDVVRAYKSLLKEKEALEASLKVLSVSQEVDLSQCGGNMVAAELAEDHCSLHSEDSLDTAASLETATSINSEGASRGEQAEDEHESEHGDTAEPESNTEGTAALQPVSRVLQLKSQLSTLTSSLATVTQEKSRMEASFQADKRKLKQELEELQEQLEASERQWEAELASLQEQLVESKARVITQQHEREQEQGDHALMLRELQKLLQEERGLRQDTELRLEDTNTALLEAMQAAKEGAALRDQLDKVSEQRDEALRRLQETEAEKNQPDPRVEELQMKLEHLKDQYQQQVHHEIRKVTQHSPVLILVFCCLCLFSKVCLPPTGQEYVLPPSVLQFDKQAGQDSKTLQSLKVALASLRSATLKEQRTFIEAVFEDHLDSTETEQETPTLAAVTWTKVNLDLTSMPACYHDLALVFSKSKAKSLPPHCEGDCAIDLLPGTTPPREDILIFSPNEDTHSMHVRTVLQRLLQHRLYVKMEKCEFHKPSVSFLGFVLAEGEVQMDLVLLLLDPSRQFVVRVDASDIDGGAVLSQVPPSDEALTPERNYGIGDRELVAVKVALEEWCLSLEEVSLPNLVLIDHKNLESRGEFGNVVRNTDTNRDNKLD